MESEPSQNTVLSGIQNVPQTLKNISSPRDLFTNKKSLLFIFLLVVITGLFIFFVIRRIRRQRRNILNLIQNKKTLKRWETHPISTGGVVKIQTDEIDIPESDQNTTYAFTYTILEWNPESEAHQKEIFLHGLGSVSDKKNCCHLQKDDILHVSLDSKKNDLLISIKTNRQCAIEPADISRIAVGKSGIYAIPIEQTNTDTFQFYTRDANAQNCWNMKSIQRIAPYTTLEDVFVLSHEYLPDAVYFLLRNTENPQIPQTAIYQIILQDDSSMKNMNRNKKNKILPMILIAKSNYDFTRFSATYTNSRETLSKTSKNSQTSKNLKISNNTPQIHFTAQVIVPENSNNDALKKLNYTFTYSSENSGNSLNNEEVFEFEENTSSLTPPIGTQDQLVRLDDQGTVYKCTRPCNGTYMAETQSNTNSFEFSHVAMDKNYTFAIEKGTHKIFTQKHGEDEWFVRNTQIGSNENLDDFAISPFSRESNKMWILQNNIPIPLSKCIQTQQNAMCSQDTMLSHTEEVLRIKNIPVGEPFHVAITLASKYIEVYLDGSLVKTHTFKGKRPSETIPKPFRFFGSQFKANATLSKFRYFPFSLNIGHIKALHELDKEKNYKKKAVCI